MRCAENQLWSAVVSRTNVRHVCLVSCQHLGGTEIAQFQYGRGGIYEQILWLDVAVTDSQRVNVAESSEQLIHERLQRNVCYEMCSGRTGGLTLT